MDTVESFCKAVDEFINKLEKGGPGSGRHPGDRREEPAIREYRNLIGRYNQAASAHFANDPHIQEYMNRLKTSWRSHILDLGQAHVDALHSKEKEGE